ncbi:MAG: thioredoxin domain-containing protein [Ignavibacteriaceae bacterium]|nr:thioredoxin domain-containing protein [Ignavibacteriaceae bacterium]
MKEKNTNLLINEKSPYLLQHAYNPVNWYPWGKEAFEISKKLDKPVFLSIGYSTCHWCHVMEKESFEDDEVAKLMNDNFISIKVDREERPDVDSIYMSVCQLMTGSGGWPLTVLMTPDRKPFFAGTYFPKSSRFGKIGMTELIPRISYLWNNNRSQLLKSSEQIVQALIQSSFEKEPDELNENIFDKTFLFFSDRFDKINGGFGSAPKFPSPHNLMFLLRYHKRKGSARALEMVEKTLTQMRLGGIYDHIGFGFSRYSTDSKWLVPHFEKMLYDQSMLSMAYTELFLLTNNNFYQKTSEEILHYVLRNMTSPEGGFFSAEDADSEGEEGKFYLWTQNEIENILGKNDSVIFCNIFGVETEGNWVDPFHGSVNGTNILHLPESLESISNELKIDINELNRFISSSREKLFEIRERRKHPHKDDKILTDWNALMISAFAKAGIAFQNSSFVDAAENCAKFILKRMTDNQSRLFHRFRDGEAAINGFLDDYAFFINALIDLYEATFNSFYLGKAIHFNNLCIKHFWDDDNGGFYYYPDYAEELLIRQKDLYDGAIPSGNSAALLNLLKISRITGDHKLSNKADTLIKSFAKRVNENPHIFCHFLSGIDFALGPSYEIVVSGEEANDLTIEMLSILRQTFLPNKVIMLRRDESDLINQIAPLSAFPKRINNQTTLYICENYTCRNPITSATELRRELNI